MWLAAAGVGCPAAACAARVACHLNNRSLLLHQCAAWCTQATYAECTKASRQFLSHAALSPTTSSFDDLSQGLCINVLASPRPALLAHNSYLLQSVASVLAGLRAAGTAPHHANAAQHARGGSSGGGSSTSTSSSSLGVPVQVLLTAPAASFPDDELALIRSAGVAVSALPCADQLAAAGGRAPGENTLHCYAQAISACRASNVR